MGVELAETEEAAVERFENEFKRHTGNEWADRNNFQKKPGKKALVDISYKRVRRS